MAIRFTTVDEAIERTGLKILVHGFAGSGKTILSATANEKTVIINVEAGMLSLRKFLRENPHYNKKIKVASIDDIVDLENLRDQFKYSDTKICEWICIDSASEIAERIIGEEKKSGIDGRGAYGNLADRMMDCFRDFRDLPGYNILFTCKQTIEMVDEKPRYVPLFPGRQITTNVPYLFDEVFALRVEDDTDNLREDGTPTQYRVLQTNRDVRYEAKDRSGELDMFEPPNLEHIKNKIEAASNQSVKNDELTDWQEKVLTDDNNKSDTEEVKETFVFDSDSYFYHPESNNLYHFTSGQEIPKGSLEHCVSISQEKYEEMKKDENQESETSK